MAKETRSWFTLMWFPKECTMATLGVTTSVTELSSSYFGWELDCACVRVGNERLDGDTAF
jgi:hypothetical protein